MRTNLKKLGCLFEAFIGALFLDCNKIKIESEWNFDTGPGFQMVQIFIQNIFETHIDWTSLLVNDDNYKNILQVKLQKEFKVTPHYIEMEYNVDNGFKMGVYLCININIHNLNYKNAVTQINNIHQYLKKNNNKIFLFLGEGNHKIKRKAEQIACFQALELLDKIINK
jgi:dsRNA-specific ribonuclease